MSCKYALLRARVSLGREVNTGVALNEKGTYANNMKMYTVVNIMGDSSQQTAYSTAAVMGRVKT